MADPLTEALGQVQGQYLQTSPSYQFGSVLSQQRNPYATTDDPWSAIAANAAQQLFAGLATGYGQQQAANQMAQIAPLVPQLYQNPMAVQAPNVDRDILSFLQVAAQNQQAKRATDLQDLALQEQIKVAANPASKLSAIQAKQAELNLQREMAGLLGLDPSSVGANLRQQYGLPVEQATAKAPPMAPTQANQPVQPAGQIQLEPVPDVQSLVNKNLQTMSYGDAVKAANDEISKINQVNRERATFKQQEDFKEGQAIRAEQREADKGFETSMAAIEQIGKALKDVPNYAGEGGGLQKWWDTQQAAYLPEGSKRQAKKAKGIAAADVLTGTTPIALAPIRKEILSGATSNFDVEFLLRPFPSDFKLSESNAALFKNLQTAANIRKAEKQFRTWGESRGLPPQAIIQKWNDARASMGGSFLDGTGQLKPEFGVLVNKIGGSL